jgi:protein phosphatase
MNMIRKTAEIPVQTNDFFSGTHKAETVKSKENGSLMGAAMKSSESHPNHCEDRYSVMADMVAVYDGVGGSFKGEEAAKLAKSEVESRVVKLPEQKTPELLAASLRQILKATSEEIYKKTALKTDGTRSGKKEMASTVALLKIWKGKAGERKAVIAHVGDSRVYRLRNGELTCLTQDDVDSEAILPDAIKRGEITVERAQEIRDIYDNLEYEKELSGLNDEEQQIIKDMIHFRSTVTQSLGEKSIKPHTSIHDVQVGDQFLVMSDGITDPLPKNKITASLSQQPERTLMKKAQDLIVLAEKYNAEHMPKNKTEKTWFERAKEDDKTAVILECTPVDDVVELDNELLQEAGELQNDVDVQGRLQHAA